jgi:hypothetical protein
MSGPRRYRATTGAGDAREQGKQPLQAAAQSARREQPRPSHVPNHIRDTEVLGKKGRGRESTSTVAGEVSGELQSAIRFFLPVRCRARERNWVEQRRERRPVSWTRASWAILPMWARDTRAEVGETVAGLHGSRAFASRRAWQPHAARRTRASWLPRLGRKELGCSKKRKKGRRSGGPRATGPRGGSEGGEEIRWAARGGKPDGPRGKQFGGKKKKGQGKREAAWAADAEPAHDGRREGGERRPGWAARRGIGPRERGRGFLFIFPI